ncbi:uncharacterized protein A1O9_07723 [Exophiala aquamarina CBS 119918]|uniref:Transcription factor domain-containing protein n=1 Tax=Exophiala aquamarina CBS 119918 TaxID=1182545 RepID=A0A072P8S8_9EURO|nr:uncharacterized protein A1O9_07723 [Exophiala aquamarina CBS 119918]KEF56142.1 hypothetical protein A1O9_07723 [Exophiala aquamarina CBS 119918]
MCSYLRTEPDINDDLGEQDFSTLENAYAILNQVVCAVRLSGFLSLANILAQESPTSERQTWIDRGYTTNLVFAVFRLGSHLSCVLNLPPLLRFEEFDLPFPPTNAAWNASDEDWKRTLDDDPPHRTHGAFNYLTILALSRLSPVDRLKLPGYYTQQDFELGLCTMQSRLWEETQCQRLSHELAMGQSHLELDEPRDKPAPFHGGFGQSWPVLLGIWRVTMEQFRRSPSRYSGVESEKEAYFTGITLYHASLIRAHSDYSLIRRLAFALCEGSTPSNYIRQWELNIQDWTRSHEIREALWHAAQIVRCFADETQTPDKRVGQDCIVTCVATDCLFRAGLVIWVHVRSTMACDLCGPTAAMPEDLHQRYCSNRDREAVELTTLDQSSRRYENWLRRRGRSCVEGVLVCACRMPILLKRCCELLRETTRNSNLLKRYLDIFETLMKHR